MKQAPYTIFLFFPTWILFCCNIAFFLFIIHYIALIILNCLHFRNTIRNIEQQKQMMNFLRKQSIQALSIEDNRISYSKVTHFITQYDSFCSTIWLKSRRIQTLIREPLLSSTNKDPQQERLYQQSPAMYSCPYAKTTLLKKHRRRRFFNFFFFVFFFILVLVLVLREANLLIIKPFIC